MSTANTAFLPTGQLSEWTRLLFGNLARPSEIPHDDHDLLALKHA